MAQARSDKQAEPPPTRRGWATPLYDEAAPVGQTAFARAGFADPSLVLRWDEIAGREVARIARPIKLGSGPSGGVLTLSAEPGAALFLQHETRALCERINAYLGRAAVARLRFVQAAITSRPLSVPRLKPVQVLTSADPATGYHGPDGLRDALLRLAQMRKRGQN